jgi:hypothetical protein
MSHDAHGSGGPIVAGSPFSLPAARPRVGAGGREAEDSPGRLLTMLAVGFLLASPVITLLLAVP